MNAFLKTTLRVLRKDFAYSVINLCGLSVGLAVGFLIFLYVSSELSYDKHYQNSDQVYRLGITYNIGGSIDQFSNLARPIGPSMKNEYPEIIAQSRVAGYNGLYDHSAFFEDQNKNRISSKHVFTADSTFFQVFNKEFISGSNPNPLDNPKSVVLSEGLAKKIFGNESPLQKVVKLDGTIPVTVTGVFKEMPNAKSHLPAEAILSWDLGARPGEDNVWIGWHVYTYCLFKEGFDPENLVKKFESFKEKYMAQTLEHYNAKASLILQPLESIHLHSNLKWEAYENGSYNDVLLFSLVALFLIIITSINYINLTTARASVRAKEIGVKKVMGCRVPSLRVQFLAESVVMVIMAAIVGWLISALMLDAFNQITGQNIGFSYLYQPDVLGIYLSVSLVIGLFSGGYPAYYMSSISVASMLKGRYASSKRGMLLRKGLITLQFTISIAIIASTVLVIRQLNFIGSKDLGFEKENVMVVEVKGNPTAEKIEGFMHKLMSHPDILMANSTKNIPGLELNQTLFDIPDKSGEYVSTGGQFVEVDKDFIEVLNMELAEGRNFFEDSKSDISGSILLNQAAVEQYGWKGEAIGKKIGVGKDSLGNRYLYEVIGVVKNFHVGSLHHAVQPIVLFQQEEVGNFMMIKLSNRNTRTAVDYIVSEWEKFDHSAPMDYTFLDQKFQAFYDRENKLFTVLIYISLLIIGINALGLLGLLMYSVKQKRREIGIRRVLGSSFLHHQQLLMKEYSWTLGMSIIFGSFVSWYLLNSWLQNFHYRIGWQGWEFVIAILIVVLITLAVFGIILKRTLSENPAHVLRHE